MRSSSLTRHLPAATCVAALALFAASPAIAGADHGRGEGPLVTYGPAIPEGATARVTAVYDASGKSTIILHVRGLQPSTKYGAHAHVNGCHLTDPLASGPHFQHRVDPAAAPGKPSVDPAYANPRNEIWLDLTTNAAGNGVARAVVPWQLEEERRPMSVVLHRDHTSTAPGSAGTAGPRLACLDVDF